MLMLVMMMVCIEIPQRLNVSLVQIGGKRWSLMLDGDLGRCVSLAEHQITNGVLVRLMRLLLVLMLLMLLLLLLLTMMVQQHWVKCVRNSVTSVCVVRKTGCDHLMGERMLA